MIKRCWETHPEYSIPYKGNTYWITGGSCTSHYPKGFDVFIGFDYSMKTGIRQFPWEDGVDIAYPIQDRGVPKQITNFKKLLEWTRDQMVAGKSVYCGCIGGHGRTGLFLAALTTYMTGDKDSITTVRTKYCTKAVESAQQVSWLNKHFGIIEVPPSKMPLKRVTHSSSQAYGSDLFGSSWGAPSSRGSGWKSPAIDNKKHKKVDGKVSENIRHHYYPVAGGCVFSVDE